MREHRFCQFTFRQVNSLFIINLHQLFVYHQLAPTLTTLRSQITTLQSSLQTATTHITLQDQTIQDLNLKLDTLTQLNSQKLSDIEAYNITKTQFNEDRVRLQGMVRELDAELGMVREELERSMWVSGW